MKKEVSYFIITETGSYGFSHSMTLIKHAAWLLLRSDEPHKALKVETILTCVACGGKGEISSLRKRKVVCKACKGVDSYVSLTTEELRADDLKEAISGTWNT